MDYKQLENYLKNRERKVIPINGYKPAASLVPLVFNEKIHLLITKRAPHLKNHPGEYSFPGGHIEDGDNTGIETALRETEEEIGIPREQIKVIGVLDDVVSVTNFHLVPYIGIVPYLESYPFDKNEVASVHLIPLKIFLDRPKIVTYYWKGEEKPSVVYDYHDIRIFGVTAFVIKRFVEILERSEFLKTNNNLL